VLTKFDNFDSLETQQRAVQLVNDGIENLGAAVSLNLGPHAVISITGDKEEREELVEKYKVEKSRAGISTLKSRLQPIFANLIKQNMPHLKQLVSSRLSETRIQLDKVGRSPKSPSEIVANCIATLKGMQDKLEVEHTEECFVPMKKQIYSVENDITLEFTTSHLKLNSFQCVFFQGQDVFDEVVGNIQSMWNPIMQDYLKKSKDTVLESILCLREDARTKMHGSLISVIYAECKSLDPLNGNNQLVASF
jgi:hypothetical protein